MLKNILQLAIMLLPCCIMAAVQGVSGAWYYCANRQGLCRAVNQLLFPPVELSMEAVDPNGLLDCKENPDFYAIYNSSEDQLPLG